MEGELPNGLIVGHAYSVTDAKNVCVTVHLFMLSVLKTRKPCAIAQGTTARCGARSHIQNEYRVIQIR